MMFFKTTKGGWPETEPACAIGNASDPLSGQPPQASNDKKQKAAAPEGLLPHNLSGEYRAL